MFEKIPDCAAIPDRSRLRKDHPGEVYRHEYKRSTGADLLPGFEIYKFLKISDVFQTQNLVTLELNVKRFFNC